MSKIENVQPSELLTLGQSVSQCDPEPTLLRFPGPCGFAELARNQLTHLAPLDSKYLYMFKNKHEEVLDGINCFGVLTVFSPARFGAVRLTDKEALGLLGFKLEHLGQIYLGFNKPIDPVGYFWMPPEMYSVETDWTAYKDIASLTKKFGHFYDIRLKEMSQQVLSYMEEVGSLVYSGISPSRPWYKFSADERIKVLKDGQIKGTWSK